VEGIAREHRLDRIRFFNIAVASLRELGYGLHTCRRLGYIEAGTFEEFEQKLTYIAAPLHGLIKRERAKKAARRSDPL
jgi:four helix bundle protein